MKVFWLLYSLYLIYNGTIHSFGYFDFFGCYMLLLASIILSCSLFVSTAIKSKYLVCQSRRSFHSFDSSSLVLQDPPVAFPAFSMIPLAAGTPRLIKAAVSSSDESPQWHLHILVLRSAVASTCYILLHLDAEAFNHTFHLHMFDHGQKTFNTACNVHKSHEWWQRMGQAQIIVTEGCRFWILYTNRRSRIFKRIWVGLLLSLHQSLNDGPCEKT